MADRISPTPRNKLTGLLADFLGGSYDYAQRPDPTMPMGKANAVLSLLSDALPLKSTATVLDDLSYGQAPTRGTGMTTRLTPEATELAMAAAPFPKTSGRAALAALGAVDQGALNKAAIVWHGSPHKFDRFDASKIGTGEGAQAYGHGIYTAEAQATGQSYKDTLRGLRTDTNGVVSDLMPNRHFTTKERAEIFKAAMEEDKPVEVAARQLGYRQASIRDVPADVLRQAVERVREQGQGYLYKVDLPDNAIARMLDWDKPLSQQALGVQAAASARLAELRALGGSPPKDPSGEWLHRAFQPQAGEQGFGQSLAADRLRQAGIPGIRYLDGGSRGAGQGSSNFVVFPGEENALTILERNGRSLLD